MDRHYNKSINPVVTTVVPHLVLDMIFTAMLQPAKTPTQGWTYIPSFIALSPGSFTQSFSAGTFYFQPVEVDVFYKNI